MNKEKTLRPLFNWIGSKRMLLPVLLNNIPPQYDLYVEPFIGGGSLFWNMEFDKAIINDKDKDLIEAYKLIKKVDENYDYDKGLDTLDKIKAYFNKQHNTNEEKLIYEMLRHNNSFNSQVIDNSKKIYKASNPYYHLKHIKEYKEQLKNTLILNEDYISIIKKYDSPNTFFYLDPPYENSEDNKLYDNSVIDYEKMRDTLKQVKGKFLLSINYSKYIKQLFSMFKIKRIVVKGVGNKVNSIGDKDRQELLIMNY